jgi:hypothetical protein
MPGVQSQDVHEISNALGQSKCPRLAQVGRTGIVVFAVAAAEAQDVTEKPKRRFWQIHLSTAVITMLVTAVLLGLNLTNYYHKWGHMWGYGWPWVAYVPGWIHPLDRNGLVANVTVAFVIITITVAVVERINRGWK